MLQDKAAQSEFGLEVVLQGINGVSTDQNDANGVGSSAIVVSVVVLTLLASGYCGFAPSTEAATNGSLLSLLASTIMITGAL
jgi:hypothetical protein